jgi:hypothetical protein
MPPRNRRALNRRSNPTPASQGSSFKDNFLSSVVEGAFDLSGSVFDAKAADFAAADAAAQKKVSLHRERKKKKKNQLDWKVILKHALGHTRLRRYNMGPFKDHAGKQAAALALKVDLQHAMGALAFKYNLVEGKTLRSAPSGAGWYVTLGADAATGEGGSTFLVDPFAKYVRHVKNVSAMATDDHKEEKMDLSGHIVSDMSVADIISLDETFELVLEFRDAVGMSDTGYQLLINLVKQISGSALPPKGKFAAYRSAINAHLRKQFEIEKVVGGSGCRVSLRAVVTQRLIEAHIDGLLDLSLLDKASILIQGDGSSISSGKGCILISCKLMDIDPTKIHKTVNLHPIMILDGHEGYDFFFPRSRAIVG